MRFAVLWLPAFVQRDQTRIILIAKALAQIFLRRIFAAVSLGCYKAVCDAVSEFILEVIRWFGFVCCFLNLEVTWVIAITYNESRFHPAVLSSVGDWPLWLPLAVCTLALFQNFLYYLQKYPVSLPQDCKVTAKMLEDSEILLSTLFIFWLGDFGFLFGCCCFCLFHEDENNLWEKLEGQLVRNTYMLPSGVTSKLVARTLENPLWRPCLWRVHPRCHQPVCVPWICSREHLLLPWLFVINR